MPLDPRVLEILVCPVCHGALREEEAGQGLLCLGCRRVYPVRDGIPVMLEEEARQPGPPSGS